MEANHPTGMVKDSRGYFIKGERRVLAVSGLLVMFALVASVRPLSAQTIENPKTVEFDPSPDHNAVIDGTPVVDRYEMDFFVQGNGQPVYTLTLGKPAPDGDGRIRVNFVALLTQPLTAGTVYTALVAAVGPGGRASSAVAPDTFVFSAPCSFVVSPVNPATLAAGGGNGSVTVTTTAGCGWAASESASWLTITSGASGNTSGSVSYTATANTTASPRSTTLTVAGQSITVTQDAAPCTLTASPTNPPALAASGGSASVTVTSPNGCAWTASESASWLSITSGSSGSGNGTVSYTATANTTTSPRSTTLTVAGQAVAVTQEAAPCSFTVSPTNPAPLAASGGSASVAVTTTAGCAWTASESASWLSITSGSNDTASGTVSYTATANTTTSPRSATLMVAGQSVTVTQDATPCSFTVSPTALSIAAAGGSASISVTTTSGCAWTASQSSSWVTITSGSKGSGSGFVTITVAGNTTDSSRTTSLTVAGQSVVVSQPSAKPATPTNVRIVGSGQ